MWYNKHDIIDVQIIEIKKKRTIMLYKFEYNNYSQYLLYLLVLLI